MRALLALPLLIVAGCGSEDDRPLSWTYITQAIIRPSCATASCHSKVTAAAGLQLEEPHGAYVILTGYRPDGNFIWPNDASRSRLLKLLRSEDTYRMPPDAPLPKADIDLIERWILAGAEDDADEGN